MRQTLRALATLGVVLLLLLAVIAPLPATAAGLVLSTDYPGVVVKPGQSVDFSLSVASQGLAPGPVDLSVTDVPEGWSAPTLKGGGFTVSQVWVGTDQKGSVTLSVPVPDNAAEGTYGLTVQASLSGYTASLPLSLKVEKPKPAEAKLTTQYPSQDGPAGTDFKFQVTLQNSGDAKQLFTLGSKAPDGWTVTFHPSFDTKNIASIPVDGGSSQNLDVEIQAPDKVAEGKYTVQIGAGTGSISTTLDLQVGITGKAQMALETPDGRLNAAGTAGRQTAISLKVTNKGTSPLSKVTFSSDAPPGWQVAFNPDTLQGLAPGESQQVQAVVTPSDKAIAGDYVVSLSASAGSTSASQDIRFAVQTSTLWGVVGVLIILLVIGGVGYVFQRYGRR